MTEETPSRRPPEHCADCHGPIAKYFQPAMTWIPCRDCDGALCEKCCDKKKEKAK